MTTRTRIIPADDGGYGPAAGYLAQYQDPDTGAWFDIGDPAASRALAEAKADKYRTVADADPLPVDWHAWRTQWTEWVAQFEQRHAGRRRRPSDGPSPFEGMNMLADEVLGVWMLGVPGTDGTRLRPVELSEVTFTMGPTTTRYVGVTIDASGPDGTAVLASSFAELDSILAPLAAGNPLP